MTITELDLEVLELELPPLRTDLDDVKADLDRLGVARIADALSPAEVAALRARLEAQAEAERAAGLASMDGGGVNQRVWNLPSKGREFVDLLTKPLVAEVVGHVLEGEYTVSSHTANIAGPGGSAMVLHSDQGYSPLSTPYALAVNIMWMLEDFTEENGATRVVPGSHLIAREPSRSDAVATVAGVGPVGSALVFDGRIWHGTGANTTANKYRWGVLTYFCRPWVRPQENYAVSTHPDALAEMSPEVKAMLGFKVWHTLGGVKGPWGPGTPDAMGFRTERYIDRDAPRIGPLGD